ncbi:MAG: SDR family oxidoreductase [Deltaproteobacteria bacterium]|nr:MAG: SDR family oxidoreductase [Deltaproteobacteria bacterium]
MSERRVRFDFSGCRILVTGGTSGIGHAIARAFLEAGAHVTITGRREGPGSYEGRDLSDLDYRQLSMTDTEGIDRLASSLDGLDVLVNNAGENMPGGRSEYDPDVFEHVVAVNLFGAYRMAAACKPLLAKSRLEGGASVINLASMSSYFAVPMVPGYGAAKAGIVQMTKNLGVAWARENVRVNAIAPGIIETNMTAAMKGVPELEGPQIARTPMGRWGTPADVAPVALFLASPAARFMTGQTVNVDGGYSVA